MLRRLLLSLAVALPAVATAMGAQAAGEVVTDIAGRQVQLPEKVDRFILGESRLLPAIAILEKDPTARMGGMMDDLRQLDPASYARFAKTFPKLDSIPRLGRSAAETFSTEGAISRAPDLAIFGVEGHGPGARSREVIDALEKAGTTVLFIDFRRDPLVNTPKSMLLLGKALGHEKEAEAFVAYWQSQLDLVTSRVAKAPRPTVFLESRVGFSEDCCETMANGMMGRFLAAAGGDNIALAMLPGESGKVSLEYLLTHQPRLWIGTAVGGGNPPAAGRYNGPRIALGTGIDEGRAKATLAAALARPGISELEAVKQGRVFAVWHHFYNSPFNVAAVQALAKFMHPDLFTDIDPVATLATFHTRFQPFPVDGMFWTGR